MRPGKQVALVALTTLWIGFAGFALPWNRTRWPTAGVVGAVAVTFGAIAATLVALLLGWRWLDYANAAGSFGLGFGIFLALERRSRPAFWPRPRGLLHASVAASASYAPAALVWLAARL